MQYFTTLMSNIGESAANNWFEVGLVIIGAILGFLLSILTTIIMRLMDKKGKLRLFYKIVGCSIERKIVLTPGHKKLILPVYFELQNTSNMTRVVRDVCFYLYYEGKSICRMTQVTYSTDKNSKGDLIDRTDFGAENNSYSFVLSPRSIQKQNCEFVFDLSMTKEDEFAFDEIRCLYHNEKNQTMESSVLKVKDGWNCIESFKKQEYQELEFKKVPSNKQKK